MPKKVALDGFCGYVEEQRRAIQQVYREVEEVQYQFNTIFRERLDAWQKAMAATVPVLAGDEPWPPALAQSLLKVTNEERAKLEQEIAELQAKVQERRREADAAAAEAQAELAQLRRTNPELDAQEERIKAHCATVRQAVQDLEREIRATPFLSGFLRRRRLRQERSRRREALARATAELRQVRQTWADDKKRFQADQVQLHQRWETASADAVQIQARLDYLQGNLERLSREKGASRFLAELDAVPDCPEPLRAGLTEMVGLNRTKREYEEGLRTVAEALGLLKGVGEGMERFLLSADKVLEEQRRYNLAPLRVAIGDDVLAFHSLWAEFGTQVKDEKMLGTHPIEFSQRVNAIIGSRLSDGAIASAFEGMGQALTEATKAWG